MLKISVIIATYNRHESLKDTLNSLLAQENNGNFDYEILVIDNNSDYRTKALVESYLDKFNGKLRYLFEPNQGKSFALNSVIKDAKGEIIVLTDDDIIADSRWLNNMISCFRTYRCDVVGGRVLPLYPPETPKWIKDNADVLFGPIVMYDFGEGTNRLMEFNKPCHEFIGANLAFKKILLQGEDPIFRTDLGPGTGTMGDDTEFVKRLARKTKNFVYCGKALVWHPVDSKRITLRYLAQWHIAFGRHKILLNGRVENVVYCFGVPRYLIRQIVKLCLSLPVSIFNKKQFLQNWNELFIRIGKVAQFKKIHSKSNIPKSMRNFSIPGMKHRKLHVCFLCRTFHQNGAGTERYVYNSARILAKLGHNVHIVTAEGNEKFHLGDFDSNIMIHKIPFNPNPFRFAWRIEKIVPLFGIRYAWAVGRKVKKILKMYPIDIIEAPDWSLEAFWVAQNKKIPLCVRMHGHPSFKGNYEKKMHEKGIKNKINWLIQRSIILKARLITCVSNDFANLSRQIWKINNVPIEIVRIGIDSDTFKCNGQIAREDSIIFVGRLEESKGIGILAEAFPSIINNFPHIKIYVAGKDTSCSQNHGTWSEYLQRCAPKENLVFLGQLTISELVSYYQKCSIGVFPSLYEPGGTASLESMACGCIPIVTNSGGFKESIVNGETGIIIPVGSSEALANAVIDLLKKPSLREHISNTGIASIQGHFELNLMVQKNLELYAKTIDSLKQ